MARKNWITALACCALLALGACTHSDSDDEKVSSGGGLPPAEESAATATQALNAAKDAVAAAAATLDEADLAAADAQTREAVVVAAATAKTALDKAVEAANAVVTAAGDDAAAKKLADAAKKAVEDYKAENPLELVTLTVDMWDAETAAKDAVAAAAATLDEADLAAADAQTREAVVVAAATAKTALDKAVEAANAVVTAAGDDAAAKKLADAAKKAVEDHKAENPLELVTLTVDMWDAETAAKDAVAAAAATLDEADLAAADAQTREAVVVAAATAKTALDKAVEAANAVVTAAGDDAAAKKLADAAKKAVEDHKAENPLELVTLTVDMWDAETAAKDAVAAAAATLDEADLAAADAQTREAVVVAAATAKTALDKAVEAANAVVTAAGDDAAAKKLADAAKKAVEDYKAENPLELVTLTVDMWDAETAAKDAVAAAAATLDEADLAAADAQTREAVVVAAATAKTALDKAVEAANAVVTAAGDDAAAKKLADAAKKAVEDHKAENPLELVTLTVDMWDAETAAKDAVAAAETTLETDLAAADAQTREAVRAAKTALDKAVEAANAVVTAAGDDAAAKKLADAAKKAVEDHKKTQAKTRLNLAMLTVAVWDAEDAVTGSGETLRTAQAALAEAVAALDKAVGELDDGALKTALTKVADDAAPVPAVGSVKAADMALDTAKEAVKVAETALNTAVIPAPETPVAVSQADDDSAAPAPMTPKDRAREALAAAKKALEDAVKAADAAVKAAGDDAAEKKLAEAAKKAVEDYKAENPLKLVTLTVAVWKAEDDVTAAGDDVTAVQKAELKAELKKAQAELKTAVAALPEGDRKTALTKVADKADELRKSLAWATGANLEPGAASAAVMGKITVDRHPRTEPEDAASGWKRLEIAEKGVAYAEGKFMISPDGDGMTDELPMRAFTTRQFEYEQGVNVERDDGSKDKVGNTSGKLKTSIRLTEDGLVMKTGGDAIYYDMQREFSAGDKATSVDDWAAIGADGQKGFSGLDTSTTPTPEHVAALKAAGVADADLPTAGTNMLSQDQVDKLHGLMADKCWDGGVTCGNWANDDLTITFGKPSQAPDGSAAWHWRARVELPEGQDASKITALENRANKDLGQYDLWLSNHAGFDEGVVLMDGKEKAKDQGSAANDDHHRYLSHAAYGMFQQLDNINAYGTKRPKYGRSQAYHAGYDAFADAKDARTSDLEKQIVGTFEGRTMAHALVANRPVDNASSQFESLRGDINLKANIGGTGEGANKIKGTINNLEYFDSGGWNKGYEVSEVSLSSSEIAPNGSYEGKATADTEGAKTYSAGGSFSGNFYGPRDKPETAGWWELSDRPAGQNKKASRRIIGSYGAVCTEGCGD